MFGSRRHQSAERVSVFHRANRTNIAFFILNIHTLQNAAFVTVNYALPLKRQHYRAVKRSSEPESAAADFLAVTVKINKRSVFAPAQKLPRFITAVKVDGLDFDHALAVRPSDNIHRPVRIKPDFLFFADKLHRRAERVLHIRINFIGNRYRQNFKRLHPFFFRPRLPFLNEPVSGKIRQFNRLPRITFQLAFLRNPRLVVRRAGRLLQMGRIRLIAFFKKLWQAHIAEVVKLGKVNPADKVHFLNVIVKILIVDRRRKLLPPGFFRQHIMQRRIFVGKCPVPIAGNRLGDKLHLKIKIFLVVGKGAHDTIVNRHQIHSDFRVFHLVQQNAFFGRGADIIVAESQKLHNTRADFKIIAPVAVLRRRHRLFQHIVHHADTVPHFMRDNMPARHITLVFVAVRIQIRQKLNNVDIWQ